MNFHLTSEPIAPSGAPKMISEPIACSAQTVLQSCVYINIISKETKTSFHLTHVN
jgi:hypothetical protein